MAKGEVIRVHAETLAQSGDGVAHHGRHEIQVRGLLPGESADVRVEHRGRHSKRVHASVLSRINDHPGRRSAPCPHHGLCNGCALMDLSVTAQREAKMDMLELKHGLMVDQIVGGEGEGLRYRWSSKRVVGGKPGALQLGSYRRGTHELAVMEGCLVDHPDIVACLSELRAVGNRLEIEPYDEGTAIGDLRYVWLKTNGNGELLLTLVTAEPRSKSVRLLAGALDLPIGIAWSVQSGSGNSLRGATVRPLRGRQSLGLNVAGVEFEVGPLGFLQPNPEVAGLAYQALVQVPAGGRTRGHTALDLYAGAGVTTQLLRRSFQHVIPCESYPESAYLLGIEPELAESFLARVLSGSESKRRSVDLVVANPPRGGLGPTVCQQLNQLGAPRIHIMSCNAGSLAEDLGRLTGDGGGYRLLRTRAFDTLPQTPHVEILAWLVRKG